MIHIKDKMKVLSMISDPKIHNQIVAVLEPHGFMINNLSNYDLVHSDTYSSFDQWSFLLIDPESFSEPISEFIEKFKLNHKGMPILVIKKNHWSQSQLDFFKKSAFAIIETPVQDQQLEDVISNLREYSELNKKILSIRDEFKSATTKDLDIIGKSPKFLEALEMARKVASSNANIFITGESGTGKEVFARFIHNQSKNQKGPIVAINCSAIPDNLIESELFGHAKGSFTGAHDKRIGLFEEAQNGTLFLDEIGDLSLPLQAKILRVLQEHKVKRIGENQDRAINCRIISATNRNLPIEIKEHRFREDLFFRLDVIPIHLPPLRERKEDILRLSEFFLRKFSSENSSESKYLSYDAMKFLYNNDWRGNIRELENTIERAIILSVGEEISLDNLMPLSNNFHFVSDLSLNSNDSNNFYVECHSQLPLLEQIIQRYIEFAVLRTGGARDKAAREIGIDRKALYKRLKQISIENQKQL